MFFFFSFLCRAAIYEPIILTDNNFESELRTSAVNFIMISRRNISFCQEVMPKFRAVAETLKEKCKFFIVDDDLSPEIKKKYNFFAYPSFFVFRYANYSCEYTGERNAPSFLKYLKRILQNPISELDTARDVSDFLEEADTSVILAVDDINEQNSKELVSVFKEIAQNLTDIVSFAIATSSDSVQQLELEDLPSIRLHRSEDRTIVDYPLAFGLKAVDLRNWIISNLIPRYRQRNSVTFRDLAFDPRYSVLAFVDSTRKNSLDSMHKIMSRLVDDFGSNFTYIYSDIFDVGAIVLQLGFTGTRDLVFCVVQMKSGAIVESYLYPETKSTTPNNLARWMKNLTETKLNKSHTINNMKSEKPLEDQKGPLYKIVGTEFINSTRIPNKAILTLILGGDEKIREDALKVAQTLATEFKKQKVNNVVFNYIDFDLNDIPGFSPSAFEKLPCFLFFPVSEDRRPYLFPVNLDISQIMEIIIKSAKVKVNFKIPGKYDPGAIEL